MRKIILNVAVSLDGYIEGPQGEYDWCFTDQDYGMKRFLFETDTILFGRRSFEKYEQGGKDFFPQHQKLVFSSTLDQTNLKAEISDNIEETTNQLRSQAGKHIWLFGGADLTKSFLKLGLIDEFWLAIHPLALGSGKALFSNLDQRLMLQLIGSKTYDSGLVQLMYKTKS